MVCGSIPTHGIELVGAAACRDSVDYGRLTQYRNIALRAEWPNTFCRSGIRTGHATLGR